MTKDPTEHLTKDPKTKNAYLAGGCFWCIEADLAKAPGVISAMSGYAGGHKANPTYAEVCSEKTGHRETVMVTYDPSHTSYRDLLIYFFEHIDPTDAGGQFHDRGESYTTAIFFQDQEEKETAEDIISRLDESNVFGAPIATLVLPFVNFYPAEEYHQRYSEKSPGHYSRYRQASGHDDIVEMNKGKATRVCAIKDERMVRDIKSVLKTLPVAGAVGMGSLAGLTPEPDDSIASQVPFAKDLKKLSEMQYEVTQAEGTEPPFQNEYWDNHEEGIYVDVVSGEPLFSSHDKYDSGTGWPSFVKPIDEGALITKTDTKLGVPRTEVRSKVADSHLGHVFDDGPKDCGGKRYCMNSASMRFVPKSKLEEEGYGKYAALFQ